MPWASYQDALYPATGDILVQRSWGDDEVRPIQNVGARLGGQWWFRDRSYVEEHRSLINPADEAKLQQLAEREAVASFGVAETEAAIRQIRIANGELTDG